MVEDLRSLALVEAEVAVRKVHKRVDSTEKNQVGVVGLALGLERIVAELVAVRLVVNIVLLLPAVTVRVRRENVLVATLWVSSRD